jgi:transcriptional regulator with XRE-family HTH domain
MSHTLGGLDPGTTAALEELGAGIRYLRHQQLLTQRVLAERCGLSQSTISRLERGLAPGLRVAWLARLFAGLERDPGWPGNRPWEVQTTPSWILLMERFSERGSFGRRMRAADEARRIETQARLMQLQASLKKGMAREERDFGS